VAPPVGLTGSCGEGLEADRPFQVALSAGGLRTDLSFEGVTQRLEEVSSSLGLTFRPSRFAFAVSLGVVAGGSLDGGLGNYRLSPGFMASVSAAYTFLDGTGAWPYVAATFIAGVATTGTQNEANAQDHPQLTALDFRLAGVIGKQFFGFWLPYAGVAVFGGPVYFSPAGQSLVGSDVHHFRLSLGSSFSLPAHLEAFVEVGFLGEQNLLLGLGYAF